MIGWDQICQLNQAENVNLVIEQFWMILMTFELDIVKKKIKNFNWKVQWWGIANFKARCSDCHGWKQKQTNEIKCFLFMDASGMK